MVSNIFILDKHLVTKKALTVNGQHTFFDDLYKQDLSTGTESYEFSTNYDNIDEQDYIMFRYHKQYKLFQITEIEQSHYDGKIITTVYGESVCLELLNGAVRATTLENCNIKTFLEYVLGDTDWSYKYSATLKDKYITVKIDKTTQIWTVIQDYMSEFGYEINTRVKYEDGRATAKIIEFYAEEELGNKTYKRFEYSRNVKGIVKKKDIYDFCTALIIESNHEVIGTGLSYNADGYTKKDDSDVVFATKENKTYNSGRDYIYGVYEDNDSDSAGEAIENAVAELKRRATPKFDYEVDTALTYEEYEDVSIGDTVYVIDHSFNPILTLEARIGSLEISFTDRDECKCNLTNYKEIKSGINPTLTSNVKTIIDTYFPITSENLAPGSVSKDKINTETYDIILADSVGAVKGVFETLIAESAYIEKLEADYVKTEKLEADYITADQIDAKYVKTETLEADYITAKKIEADYIKTEKLEADYITAKEIEADYAKIETLEANYADIDNLKADKAQIGVLEANLAKINTLITGNEIVDSSAVIHLTADNAIIDNAVIKDAMIESVSAGKINAGTINTNLVNIASDTGGVSISKETMQFKDENNKVRIQIGRDTNNNFTFALYDSTGKGQLINENGIQSSNAIADGLIRNDHIDDNAAISGTKLDISSVYDEMNEDGSNTLKASKIYLNDKQQTLEVGFNSMTTKVDGNTTAISTNTTAIDAANGKIDALITRTEKLEGDTESLSSSYNSIKNTVDNHTQSIGNITTTVNGISSKQAEFEQSLNGFKTTVTNDYATKDELTGEVTKLESSMSSIEQTADKINWLVKSGNSSSNMVLTDKLYELTTEKAMISAKEIELNGSININNGTFTVDTEGNMTATSGEIGGFSIGEYKLTSTNTGICSNGDVEWAFWAGSKYGVDAPFHVGHDGSLYASNANISGNVTSSTFSSVDGGFRVDESGEVIGEDITARYNISAYEVSAQRLNVQWYAPCLTRDVTVYIKSDYVYPMVGEEEDISFYHGAYFRSFADLFAICPRNLNGYNLRVRMRSNVSELVEVNGLNNGNLYIEMCGYTLNGYFQIKGHSLWAGIYGNTSGSTNTTTRGVIKPNTGYLYSNYRYAIIAQTNKFYLYDVDIYKGKATDYPSNCISVSSGCSAYINSVKAVNTPNCLLRCHASAHAYVSSSSGTTSSTVFQAVSGSIIVVNDTTQAGRPSSANNQYYEDNNSKVFADNVTWDSVEQTGNNDNNNTSTTITRTVTIKSDTGRSWRLDGSYANSWSSDAVVRQGRWTSGYGLNEGYWFFGDDIYDILQSSKNEVTSVKIKITRQSGGNSAERTHYLRIHKHGSKPSSPSLISSSTFSKSFSLAVGASKTISLTSSEIATLKSSGAKGFGLYTSNNTTGASGNYSCCSPSATVTITYKTTD